MEVYRLEEKKAIEEVKHFNQLTRYWQEEEYEEKEIAEYITTILNLIEKQSKEIEEYKKQLDLDNECEIALNSKVMDLEKEIEELKNDRKKYAEEYIHNNPWLYKQLNENYILRVESEQKERKAWIKGTNDADELCNKKWEDKIKAKIEEYEQDVKDFEEYWSKDPRKFKKEKSVDYYKLEALKELLEKE